jgi:hypothetical protein
VTPRAYRGFDHPFYGGLARSIPPISFGRWVVSGTSVALSLIENSVREGRDIDEIIKDNPGLAVARERVVGIADLHLGYLVRTGQLAAPANSLGI